MIRALFKVLLLLPVPLFGADYYVDFAAGADSNAGTSTGAAWQHCPGDSNATSTAGAATLSAGDTVHFRGGVEYHGEITTTWDGSSGNRIVYDGNLGDVWGTGRAIIDGEHTRDVAFTGSDPDYITWRGFHIRNLMGYADDDPILGDGGEDPITTPSGAWAMDFDTGGSNLSFIDIYFERIGQWRNVVPFSGTGSVTGYGLYTKNCTDVLVQDCEFTKMKVGILIRAQGGTTSGYTVDGCNIHNYINWGIDISTASSGDTIENVEITDLTLHDFTEFDLGNWGGYGEKPHTDGIFIRTAGQTNTVWTNVNIHGNTFYQEDRGASQGGTAMIYISEGPSVNIYNNRFLGASVGVFRPISVGHSNPTMSKQYVRIMNNTFVDDAACIQLAGEADTADREVSITGNIFHCFFDSNGDYAIAYLSGVAPVMDYNLYYAPGYASTRDLIWWMGGLKNLAELRADESLETNGNYADPKLGDVSATYPTAAADFVVTLQSDSPAIDDGTSQSAYFTEDYLGVSRPQGSAWDVGAYEYEVTANPKQHSGPTGRSPSIGITGGGTTLTGGYSIGN